MTERRVVLAVILAATVISPASAGSSTRWGMGGKTRDFAEDVAKADQSGELFRIKGHCQSACTMFLAVRNVCIEPSARLLFHAAKTSAGTERMLNSYNERLRGYLEARRIMESPRFHAISGVDMIRKFGYMACPKGK
jgi:hypothetical protein